MMPTEEEMKSRLVMFTLYRNPRDFPGMLVARRLVVAGGSVFMFSSEAYVGPATESNLFALNQMFQSWHFQPREADDAPAIVGTWL